MVKVRKQLSKNDFARILMIISLTFIFYGLILQFFYPQEDVLDPINDVVPIKEEDSSVHIDKPSSNGDIEVFPSGKDQKIVNLSPNIETEIATLRNKIQTKYGITVLYGKQTEGYSVGGLQTNAITNNQLLWESLNRLLKCLEKYPTDLFLEIKRGGIPLTIVLIHNYSDINVTGVTDSGYSYAKISLAVTHSLEESFYHECYHYIERYLFKQGANFNSWNALNPSGFEYGTIYNFYSYNNTFKDSAPFVNNYAQTMDTEDRASTFEYMMADEKVSCLNNGQTVWRKAVSMARTIEYVLDSVSPSVTEYWERFL